MATQSILEIWDEFLKIAANSAEPNPASGDEGQQKLREFFHNASCVDLETEKDISPEEAMRRVTEQYESILLRREDRRDYHYLVAYRQRDGQVLYELYLGPLTAEEAKKKARGPAWNAMVDAYLHHCARIAEEEAKAAEQPQRPAPDPLMHLQKLLEELPVISAETGEEVDPDDALEDLLADQLLMLKGSDSDKYFLMSAKNEPPMPPIVEISDTPLSFSEAAAVITSHKPISAAAEQPETQSGRTPADLRQAIIDSLAQSMLRTQKDLDPAYVQQTIAKGNTLVELLRSRPDALEHYGALAKTAPDQLMKAFAIVFRKTHPNGVKAAEWQVLKKAAGQLDHGNGKAKPKKDEHNKQEKEKEPIQLLPRIRVES